MVLTRKQSLDWAERYIRKTGCLTFDTVKENGYESKFSFILDMLDSSYGLSYVEVAGEEDKRRRVYYIKGVAYCSSCEKFAVDNTGIMNECIKCGALYADCIETSYDAAIKRLVRMRKEVGKYTVKRGVHGWI